LLFQTLDSKKECHGIFCNGKVIQDYDQHTLTRTWAPTNNFMHDKIQYAQVWAAGKSLSQVCPDHIKDDWDEINKKARAMMRSIKISKINLDDICLYDTVPAQFLIDFYSIREQIIDWVFLNYKKPDNHDLMRDLIILLKKINKQSLNLEYDKLNFYNPKVRNSFPKIKNSSKNISYCPWKTVTGRLATKANSFPILTLNRELRSAIKPKNDLLLELDYNSAELRAFLGLVGELQPKNDLHSWIAKDVFSDKYSREQTKKKVFAWLYNPKASNKKLNDRFNRELALKKYYVNGHVKTPYNRQIQVDQSKALNYLIQSTASDLFLTSMIKVDKFLKGRRSFVSFCVHDSLILDLAKEDKDIITKAVDIFSTTKLGKFKTNISIGLDYGSMKRLR
tara:strand:+ start:825 stop:2003 length:1179 start_codon:yes stop_codon:yes gene_type:complete